MQRMTVVFSFIFMTLSAHAVEMKTSACWKGYGQIEQNENLAKCINARREMQMCSTKWTEHGGAAFDVCLMEPTKNPTRILEHYKGFRQSEQNANLENCRRNEGNGKICVTNWSVHKQAVYDVCLMQ